MNQVRRTWEQASVADAIHRIHRFGKFKARCLYLINLQDVLRRREWILGTSCLIETMCQNGGVDHLAVRHAYELVFLLGSKGAKGRLHKRTAQKRRKLLAAFPHSLYALNSEAMVLQWRFGNVELAR